jgi:ATP adenylyltransferase
MKPLFTPWRMPYIKNNAPNKDCAFCAALTQKDNVENLIIHRAKTAFVILNRFPYSTGHLMVIPYQHVAGFDLLDAETRSEMMELLTRAIDVLKDLYQPAGFNVGVNIGAVAGAGIATHLHMHVVPRWPGDSNYMAVIGETRIIPEDLDVTYRRVIEVWDQKK